MRFLVLLDAPADAPLADLEGKTPLQAARTPTLDRLSRLGRIGKVVLGPLVGPDAWWTLLGGETFGGLPRGPLEAAAWEIPLERRDLAFCGPLVATDGVALTDAAPDALSAVDARALLDTVERLRSSALQLFAPPDGRAVLRWTDGAGRTLDTVAPEAAQGHPLAEVYPRGDGAERLRRLIEDSYELLDDHPVNRRRRGDGRAPANLLWPWGQGTALALPGLAGSGRVAVGSDTAWIGLARAAGVKASPVERDSDIERACLSRVRAALAAGDRGAEAVLIHLRADGAGVDGRLAAIEAVDGVLLAGLADGCAAREVDFALTAVWCGPGDDGGALFVHYDSAAERREILPFDGRGAAETAWKLGAQSAGWTSLIGRI